MANTVRLYRQNLRVNLGDWLKRPLDTVTRQDVEDRFNLITGKHGWAAANQTLSMLRSIYRRPCVDHENLRNPVELWLVAGGRFNKMRRRRISGPAEVLPRWRAGIEAMDLEPCVPACSSSWVMKASVSSAALRFPTSSVQSAPLRARSRIPCSRIVVTSTERSAYRPHARSAFSIPLNTA